MFLDRVVRVCFFIRLSLFGLLFHGCGPLDSLAPFERPLPKGVTILALLYLLLEHLCQQKEDLGGALTDRYPQGLIYFEDLVWFRQVLDNCFVAQQKVNNEVMASGDRQLERHESRLVCRQQINGLRP